MANVGGASSDWLGDLAAAYLPQPDTKADGDCLGLGTLGIMGLNCDMISNFVCQAPDPPLAAPFPSIRLVLVLARRLVRWNTEKS
jgi:hypothetical protein